MWSGYHTTRPYQTNFLSTSAHSLRKVMKMSSSYKFEEQEEKEVITLHIININANAKADDAVGGDPLSLLLHFHLFPS